MTNKLYPSYSGLQPDRAKKLIRWVYTQTNRSFLGIKSIIAGFLGSLALFAFYFISMRLLSNSWETTFSQFEKIWYFALPLSFGFGIQVGLYHFLKSSSKKILAANTTTSTIGMVAYCAHHLTDILPILGFSVLTLFLVEFQIPIILIGILSNLFGVFYLIQRIRRNKK